MRRDIINTCVIMRLEVEGIGWKKTEGARNSDEAVYKQKAKGHGFTGVSDS